MNDPVHSVNILIGLLLFGVAYILYLVITYDNRQ